MRGRKGFTLIELLVVIAIIAILAAILFPVFAQARAKARQASCLSNIKQLSLAVLMYADDWDETVVIRNSQSTPNGLSGCWPGGWVPGYRGPVTDKNNNENWADSLYPYVKNKGLYICPTFGKFVSVDENRNAVCAPAFGGIMANDCGFSELMPACLGADPLYNFNTAAGARCTRTMGQFTNPSNSVMFGDGGCFFICKDDDYGDPLDKCLNDPSSPYYWPVMYQEVRRHNGGGNYSFFDGHCKWSKPESMSPKQFQCEGLPRKYTRTKPPTPIT